MAKKEITQSRLKELLAYDPDTGVFTWRMKRGPRSAGSVAGSTDKDGYILINVDGCQYRAHRLAILYVTGVMPTTDVDHRRGNRTDNRFDELRVATRTQNSQNSLRHSDSRSGLKGAHYHPRSGRWLSRIRMDGKNVYLGIYRTAEEANAAYVAKAMAAFGEFYRPPEQSITQ